MSVAMVVMPHVHSGGAENTVVTAMSYPVFADTDHLLDAVDDGNDDLEDDDDEDHRGGVEAVDVLAGVVEDVEEPAVTPAFDTLIGCNWRATRSLARAPGCLFADLKSLAKNLSAPRFLNAELDEVLS